MFLPTRHAACLLGILMALMALMAAMAMSANPQPADTGVPAQTSARDPSSILAILPETDLQISGPKGGPFSLSFGRYFVISGLEEPFDWLASAARDWLSLMPNQGVLGFRGLTTVSIQLSSAVDQFPGGLYVNSFYFLNGMDGTSQSRLALLRVQAPPAIPAQPTPADQETSTPVTGDLGWSMEGQPHWLVYPGFGEEERATYDVYFDTVNPPRKRVAWNLKFPYLNQKVVSNTRYFWRVVAKNIHGGSTSPVWTFRTRPLPRIVMEDSVSSRTDRLMPFGTLLAGATRTEIITISNQGNAPLIITSATLTQYTEPELLPRNMPARIVSMKGAIPPAPYLPFAIQNLPSYPVHIPPGVAGSLQLTFTPTETMTTTATFIIASNDPQEPYAFLTASGSSLLPARISHLRLWDTISTGPYPVAAAMSSSISSVGSVHLNYRVNQGPWSSIAMDRQGASKYRSQIPSRSVGDVVEYYLEARNTSSTVLQYPFAAPPGFEFAVKGIPRITVSPPRLDFHLSPGASATTTVLLSNSGTWPTAWAAYEREIGPGLDPNPSSLSPLRVGAKRPPIDWQSEHVPGMLLVGFRPGVGGAARLVAHRALGATPLHSSSLISMDAVRSKSRDLRQLAADYLARPDVAYVEPNYIYRATREPNDALFYAQWSLSNIGQNFGSRGADIRMLDAWSSQTGSREVLIAILDSGVDYTHPDLAPNLWTNAAEANGLRGVDDDQNGIIDDIYGANWTTGTAIAISGDPMEDQYHGTHVAGIIGAVGNNGLGIAGANWRVRLMPLKFLNVDGVGAAADAVAAVEYAVAHGAHLVNCSWGGPAQSKALKAAIETAGKAGQLFIAAAGNDGKNADIHPAYPAAYEFDWILSVASTTNRDARSSFSNWGAFSVDLAAPGANIVSTFPGGAYVPISGTSMAAPHVAGVAGLVLAQWPGAPASQVRRSILEGVDKINALRLGGPTPVASEGRLNAMKALALADVPWLRVDPAAGSSLTLGAGSSLSVRVAAGTEGLPQGTSTALALVFAPREETAPPIEVPVVIHVLGTPLATGVNKADYAIDVLRPGKLLYGDRPFAFVAPIADGLENQLYIRTRNADKDSTGTQFLAFDLSRNAIVLVAHDSRYATPPVWLQSWQKHPAQLLTTDGKGYRRNLYYRKFARGRALLGGNRDSNMPAGYSMYSVIIVPDAATGAHQWERYE